MTIRAGSTATMPGMSRWMNRRRRPGPPRNRPRHDRAFVGRQRGAALRGSRCFVIARVVMGSATFFDAFNALSIAFVLPILVPLWHITAPQVGITIGASY